MCLAADKHGKTTFYSRHLDAAIMRCFPFLFVLLFEGRKELGGGGGVGE